MDLGLKGKVAIVTGGANGIGATVVEEFAKEGANVVIADIDFGHAQEAAKKAGKCGVKVIAVRADVTKQADIDKVVSQTLKEFGKIDILVNDAGVEGAMVKLPDLSEEQWDKVNDVNVKGTYLMTRAVIPHMVAAKYGKIVNFSSFYGREGFADDCEYCASKFAVVGITQSIAKEYAEHNITVNAVCPGIVRTPMWERVLDILVERTGNPNREEIWEHWVGTIPLKRPQTTQDIANAVLFLSSDVSRNITGESININGGLRVD